MSYFSAILENNYYNYIQTNFENLEIKRYHKNRTRKEKIYLYVKNAPVFSTLNADTSQDLLMLDKRMSPFSEILCLPF